MKEILLKSKYKNFEIKILFENPQAKSTSLLINIHGAYDSFLDPFSKAQLLQNEVKQFYIETMFNFVATS